MSVGWVPKIVQYDNLTGAKHLQSMMSRLLGDSSRLVVLVVVVVGCLLYLHHTQQSPAQEQLQQEPPNPLDGCLYVYLDMGTNVGVQIRSVCTAS